MEHKFKKGDIIRGNVDSDKRYTITNTRMTKAKVTDTNSNGSIDIQIIEHNNTDFVGREFLFLDSKYFDLVDEKGDRKEDITMEHKFKVGDIVRGNGHFPNCATTDMIRGEVVEIDENGGHLAIRIIEHKNRHNIGAICYGFSPEYFDLVERPVKSKVKFPEMHIYTDGKTTTAVYKHDGIKETANAVCSPDDKFDFRIGAKLAVERLEKKPKLLNTKFVCLTDGVQGMTRGKIYEVKDGQFKRDNGCTTPFLKRLENIADLKVLLVYMKDRNFESTANKTVDFVEVVE